MSTFPNASGGSEDEPTYDDLYERAQELDIDGRSDMDKEELAAAVAEAEAEQTSTTGETEGTAPTVRDVTDATPSASGAVKARSEHARSLTTNPDDGTGPGAGRVLASAQPDHTPDEDGFVGVDPVYRNASDSKRMPATGEGDKREVPARGTTNSGDEPTDDDE